MMTTHRKILIVDDEYSIRSILAEFLVAEGYEVTTAGSGDEAILLAGRECYDLVITDMIMPGRDGIETILALRAKHPKIRIIAMSGGGTGGSGSFLPLAAKVGASRTLTKPFGRTALLEALEGELGRPVAAESQVKASVRP